MCLFGWSLFNKSGFFKLADLTQADNLISSMTIINHLYFRLGKNESHCDNYFTVLTSFRFKSMPKSSALAPFKLPEIMKTDEPIF